MKLRVMVANILLFAVTVTWLYPFWCIVTEGSHYVAEPTPVVLWLEFIVMVLIAVFAVVNVVTLAKRWDDDK